MCIDPDSEQIFLYGGWNGSKELGDLWQFSITKNMWTCLSLDTSQQVGSAVVWYHVLFWSRPLKARFPHVLNNVEGSNSIS